MRRGTEFNHAIALPFLDRANNHRDMILLFKKFIGQPIDSLCKEVVIRRHPRVVGPVTLGHNHKGDYAVRHDLNHRYRASRDHLRDFTSVTVDWAEDFPRGEGILLLNQAKMMTYYVSGAVQQSRTPDSVNRALCRVRDQGRARRGSWKIG